MKNGSTRGSWLLASLVSLAAWSVSDQAEAQARFGTFCQKNYESNYVGELSDAYVVCGWFNDELDDTDIKVFYYDLAYAKPKFETSYDQDWLDNVNLAYVYTHGGILPTHAGYATWNYKTTAETSSMRLGDESYGLSILSTYSCDTLKTDAHIWTRWANVFKGGLRIVTGSHNDLWYGPTTNEVGEDYADNLQSSQSVKNAWKDGVSDWWHAQDAAVMSSGNSVADCASRRDGIKWQNYPDYPRRRDASVTHLCWTIWDNI